MCILHTKKNMRVCIACATTSMATFFSTAWSFFNTSIYNICLHKIVKPNNTVVHMYAVYVKCHI